jgi:hypothetical protein
VVVAALQLVPSDEVTIVEFNPALPLDAPTATNFVPFQVTPNPLTLPKGEEVVAALQLVPSVEVTIEEFKLVPVYLPTATNVVPFQATPHPVPVPKGEEVVPVAHTALQLVPSVEVTIEEFKLVPV